MRYDDTAYMFSSARIRAMETRMLSAEACERFIGAGSSEDILESLGEFGCRRVMTEGLGGARVDREASLMTMLVDALHEIREMLPSPDAVSFLQYKYDCNNIKLLLKCRYRDTEAGGMLSDAGSVPVAALREAAAAGDLSPLPPHMAAAAAEAWETCLRTSDTQVIDLLLDRACFADMAASAAATGVPFARSYVERLADLTCASMTLRVIRMGGESSRRLLEAALLEVGSIGADEWLRVAERGEDEFWRFVAGGVLAGLAERVGKGDKLAAVERASDACMMELIRTVRWLPFGAELAMAYIAGLEYGIKNVRLIMADKDAGLDGAAIRERLRDMYV